MIQLLRAGPKALRGHSLQPDDGGYVAYFIAVERFENWLVDKENEFAFFGLPERQIKKADHVKTGDILITYISSGYSMLAGARRVVGEGLVRLAYGGEYDVACPYAIPTKPILTAEPEKWVSIKALAPELSFIGKKDWRQLFRTSLKPVNDKDGDFVIQNLQTAFGSHSHSHA